MKDICVMDTISNVRLATVKSNKQAVQAIYRLEREDRSTGEFTPNRYVIVIGQYRKTDRLNKQARRAFETQEV